MDVITLPSHIIDPGEVLGEVYIGQVDGKHVVTPGNGAAAQALLGAADRRPAYRELAKKSVTKAIRKKIDEITNKDEWEVAQATLLALTNLRARGQRLSNAQTALETWAGNIMAPAVALASKGQLLEARVASSTDAQEIYDIHARADAQPEWD